MASSRHRPVFLLPKPRLYLSKEPGRNLVAAITSHFYDKTRVFLAVEVQQWRTRLFKLRKPFAPGSLAVVLSLYQLLACNVVLAHFLRVIKTNIVYPSRRRMGPAIRYAGQYNVYRSD